MLDIVEHDIPESVARSIAYRYGSPTLIVPRRLRNPTPDFLGMTYSAVPHPTYPVDPRLVAAIRRTDPGFIPLWVTYLFRNPPDSYGVLQPVKTYVRIAIARHIPMPKSRKPPYTVLMPPNATFPIPNQIDRILGGCKSKTLPEPYEPLTWDSYWRPWRQGTAREVFEQMVELPLASAARQAEYLAKERAGAKAELDAYVARKWSDVSTPELEQALERQRLGIPLNMKDDEANEWRKKILKYRTAYHAYLRSLSTRIGSLRASRKAGRL